MGQKKKHDMVLNIGSESKGNQFSDQTPTPTRFIRNCEEVGLFQDLQNVNPFEETFKKAVEAVKAGQTVSLDKSFQSNAADDTLHTPDIFPHMDDLQCAKNIDEIHSQKSKCLVQVVGEKNVQVPDKESSLKSYIEPKKLILGNVNHKKRKYFSQEKPEQKEIQKSITDNPVLSQYNEVTSDQAICSHGSKRDLGAKSSSLKDKIKTNIQKKQIPIMFQLKVPIPRSSYGTYQQPVKDKFSTFSKNSLQFVSKLEKSHFSSFDSNWKKKNKKNGSCLQKEKMDILERNRAAATRCREKKKLYVSHLEKLNLELKAANQRLQFNNFSLRKQIFFLQTQLLKYQKQNIEGSGLAAEHTNRDKSAEHTSENAETEKKEFSCRSESEKLVYKIDSPKNNESLTKRETVFDFPEICDSETALITKDTRFINTSSCISKRDLLCNINSQVDKSMKVYSDHSYFNQLNASPGCNNLNTSDSNRHVLVPSLLHKDINYSTGDLKGNSSCDIAVPFVNSQNGALNNLNGNGAVFVNVSLQPLILVPSHNGNILEV